MIDVGQTVGNYNVTAKLGEGAMGSVFLAEHPVIGSRVALKVIHPQFARSEELVARFVNEAKVANQIRHDHIVDITDFGTTPAGDFYFLMEYLQGETLAASIARQGAFPPARALNIAAQVADALDASHAHGVIHRDVKPDNVFLIARDDTMDFVKVLDFGVAKLTNGHEPQAYTTGAGTLMGTPYYMSPEQCEGRAEIDQRADIYALGVMLFEMLTGRIPFGGTSYGEVLIKHVTVPPPAARSLVPALPRSLDAIVSRALAKDPAHRFQTMLELRGALLDPEVYGEAIVAPVADDELSGRVRAAVPMARSAMGLGAAPTPDTALAPSTFRHGAGEVIPDGRNDELAPKKNRGPLVVVVGLAAVAGMCVGNVVVRQRAGQLWAAALAPRKPATVRVNFSSDPDGATVARRDGTLLGVTPLSIEVPYGDAPVEYVLRKDGYLEKVASLVPNLPSPVFAVLEKEAAPPPRLAPAAPEELDPPLTDVLATAKLATATHGATHRRSLADEVQADQSDAGDSDGVLAPSLP